VAFAFLRSFDLWDFELGLSSSVMERLRIEQGFPTGVHSAKP